MAKGLCCFAANHGDLGKVLRIPVKHKDGTISERCGTCMVARSCNDPQKRVLRFRFLPSNTCGVAGAQKCTVTPAMIASYDANAREAAGHAIYIETGAGPTLNILPVAPTGGMVPAPYSLPLQ